MTKTILITGASAGIGQQLALAFARRGYQLALAARRVDKLEALAAIDRVGLLEKALARADTL